MEDDGSRVIRPAAAGSTMDNTSRARQTRLAVPHGFVMTVACWATSRQRPFRFT